MTAVTPMHIALTPQQQQAQYRFRAFAAEEVAPHADQHDQDEHMPESLIQKFAQTGWLGAIVPTEHGGQGMDAVTFGLLCEEIGRASASLLSLLIVHGMVCQSILKWGTPEQQTTWLPRLATGERIGAFGLTEPDVGSDASAIQTRAVVEDGAYVLTGEKRWISFGQRANLFLIVAQCDGKPSAFLVPREAPGFSTEAIQGMLGFRSAMLARLVLDGCSIPENNLLGRIGFGFSHVAGSALDHGRYCVAWGCLGLLEACLDASLRYTSERKQFGEFLKGHQLIQHLVADMLTDAKATRLMCYHAGYLKEQGDPSMIMETSTAKYFASRAAMRAADSAVQIHGANGCHSRYPVQRYFRDAKIMEIIEGSNQIQQIIIAKNGYQQMLMEQRRARKAQKAAAAAAAKPPEKEAQKIKCLVWDLDHTLWDGILLEDAEVTLREGVVDIIRTLDQRGILQSIASRNEHGHAMAKLEALGLADYFLYPQINWNSKADNIKTIAQKLNIGLDTFAFIDDQVFEREEVNFSLPDVACIDAADLVQVPDMPRMHPRFITDESGQRRQMYLSDLRRNTVEAEFIGPKNEFLATLNMVLTIAPAREEDLKRAEELTMRTHQLNTTGDTYSYEELDRLRQSDQHMLLIAGLDDKYGTYGKIGLVLIDCSEQAWTIKLLLMSCRVMSRGVGGFLINHIRNAAREKGVRLLAEFVANDRNRMMYMTYKFANFRETSPQATGQRTILENDLSHLQEFPHYLTIRT
jgi:glutaryl-CoA dehydrogenase (non-decarboxylating)